MKYPILRIMYPCLVLCADVAGGQGLMAHEGDIDFKVREIKLATHMSEYEFLLKIGADEGLANIEVSYKGKAVDVAIEDFRKMKNINLRWVEMSAPHGGFERDSVILEIPYRGSVKNGREQGGDTLIALNVARLHFFQGKFKFLETCEADVKKPGVWKMSLRDLATGEVFDNGEVESDDNPFLKLRNQE